MRFLRDVFAVKTKRHQNLINSPKTMRNIDEFFSLNPQSEQSFLQEILKFSHLDFVCVVQPSKSLGILAIRNKLRMGRAVGEGRVGGSGDKTVNGLGV